MNKPLPITRYNQRIPHMRARESTRESNGLRLGWLTSFLLATVFLPTSLCASGLGDTARQLAHKIAAAAGPGAFALEVTNRSSLDDKSVRDVRSALEAQLHIEGVSIAKAEQAMGTVEVVLSESLREYVWTAEIAIGSDEKKIALVSIPRSSTGTGTLFAAALPIVLKTTLLFAQEQPMLDVALAFIWPDGMMQHTLLGDGVTEAPHMADGYMVRRTKDGWIAQMATSDRQFPPLCRALGTQYWMTDPRFATMADRIGEDWLEPAGLGPPVSDSMNASARAAAAFSSLAGSAAASAAAMVQRCRSIGTSGQR